MRSRAAASASLLAKKGVPEFVLSTANSKAKVSSDIVGCAFSEP
jgi:hypothetical protein